MEYSSLIEGLMAIASITVFFYILVLVVCVIYLIVVPYFIARHFRVTDNFTVDCIISYIATLGFGLLGNLVYIVVSLIIKNQKK